MVTGHGFHTPHGRNPVAPDLVDRSVTIARDIRLVNGLAVQRRSRARWDEPWRSVPNGPSGVSGGVLTGGRCRGAQHAEHAVDESTEFVVSLGDADGGLVAQAARGLRDQ